MSIVQMDNIDYPLTIGYMACHVGQSRLEVVKQLLDQIDLPLKINRLLLDGGFASMSVLKYLELELQIPWITRGRYSKKKNYPDEINDQWFPYRLNGEFEIPAYLLKYEKVEQPVLLLCSRRWTPTTEKTHQIYRKRFRIENTYRHARKMKIITTTRDIQLRWILWAIAHFLELLWQILRLVHQFQNLDENLIRQHRFMELIADFLKDQFLNFEIILS
ncbi:MAG: transposase [Candidatus Korarchaeota archaeon]|nr:transposase [Candidatus Korarchaeota archaeon]